MTATRADEPEQDHSAPEGEQHTDQRGTPPGITETHVETNPSTEPDRAAGDAASGPRGDAGMVRPSGASSGAPGQQPASDEPPDGCAAFAAARPPGDPDQSAPGAHPPGSEASDGAAGRGDAAEDEPLPRMTPREARRLRIVVAGAVMAATAVALWVRLGQQPSLLVVAVYGAALVLCGAVIELSRRGRTRVGMWVLGAGLVALALAELVLLRT